MPIEPSVPFGCWRLLLERDDAPLGIGFQDAEAVALLDGHHYRAQGDVGPVLLVEGDHRA